MKWYWLQGHQNKELAYIHALKQAGYRRSYHTARVIRFALFNIESIRGSNYNPKLRRLHKKRVPVFMFPHAARPMIQYDGIVTPYPHAKCAFVIAEGHKEIMKIIKYPVPTVVTGWTLTPIRKFRSREVRRILFAPIHPNGNRYMHEREKRINNITFKRLLRFSQDTGARLKVRYMRGLENNGLEMVSGVKYEEVKPQVDYCDILRNDLIVGHQTFAYMAVALGRPTIMMGEWFAPQSGNSNDTYCHVNSWDLYRDFLMFPYDILKGNLHSVIDQAMSCEPVEWKARFIGKPFNGKKFIQTVESYL
jgi:hypothetical protein